MEDRHNWSMMHDVVIYETFICTLKFRLWNGDLGMRKVKKRWRRLHGLVKQSAEQGRMGGVIYTYVDDEEVEGVDFEVEADDFDE